MVTVRGKARDVFDGEPWFLLEMTCGRRIWVDAQRVDSTVADGDEIAVGGDWKDAGNAHQAIVFLAQSIEPADC